MTTTTDDKSATEQRQLNDVHRTIRSLVGMYPADEWSLEESMVVRAALHEIALWRQRGIRGVQLEKAAADIEARDRMRALELAKTEARLAGIPQCDLCDKDGFVLDEDGQWVLDDGYEVACYHGKAMDMD